MVSISVFTRYKERFSCSPLVNLSEEKRCSVERGGKIIMPPSALAKISNLDIAYPLLFKLTNIRTKRITHTGVLEFVAEEKKIYLPTWLMRNLEVNEGETVAVENAMLPIARYSRFQPLSTMFLDITNPKAVLENYLRQFACLTTGDLLSINYNNNVYELRVLETRPSSAVNIIECDMVVDFEAPEGYQEPLTEEARAEVEPKSSEFVPFAGKGHRLDGKTRKRKQEDDESEVKQKRQKRQQRGVPDYEYEVGSVFFMRDAASTPKEEEAQPFEPFTGVAHSLLPPPATHDTDSD